MVESNHRLCYQGSAPLADALPVELISRIKFIHQAACVYLSAACFCHRQHFLANPFHFHESARGLIVSMPLPVFLLAVSDFVASIS